MNMLNSWLKRRNDASLQRPWPSASATVAEVLDYYPFGGIRRNQQATSFGERRPIHRPRGRYWHRDHRQDIREKAAPSGGGLGAAAPVGLGRALGEWEAGRRNHSAKGKLRVIAFSDHIHSTSSSVIT